MVWNAVFEKYFLFYNKLKSNEKEFWEDWELVIFFPSQGFFNLKRMFRKESQSLRSSIRQLDKTPIGKCPNKTIPTTRKTPGP